MQQPLVRLRIPAGWKVVQNHFYEIDPEQATTDRGLLEFPFYQDILQITNERLGMVLDLGWYPEADVRGRFVLVLIQAEKEKNHDRMPKTSITTTRNGIEYTYRLEKPIGADAWERPLEEFESRDWREVQTRIDTWLDSVSRGKLGRS